MMKKRMILTKRRRELAILDRIRENLGKSEYIIEIKNLNVWMGDKKLLHDVNINIPYYSIVAIIGPSGSGKSTLIKTLNRTSLDDSRFSFEGDISYVGIDLFDKDFSNEMLRTNIGTVLQKPIMFPMSIRENVLFALKARGVNDEEKLHLKLFSSLNDSYLWDEVKDRLNLRPEGLLSLGQQQRLCIARAIATEPAVLLMDEPTSALDLKASAKIEQLIKKITTKKLATIIIISHSLAQVRKISDYTIFIKDGRVVEFGPTKKIFNNPDSDETREFISEPLNH